MKAEKMWRVFIREKLGELIARVLSLAVVMAVFLFGAWLVSVSGWWIIAVVAAVAFALLLAWSFCSVAAAADEARGLQEWQQGEEADDVS